MRFLLSCDCVSSTWTLMKHIKKKLDRNYKRMLPPEQNSSCTATYFPSHKPSKQDEQDIWSTC